MSRFPIHPGGVRCLGHSRHRPILKIKYTTPGQRTRERFPPASWWILLDVRPLCAGYSHATGLICFNARYYDPEIGRFLTEDPSQQGHGWYNYCGNNPLTMVDPDGRISDIGELERLQRFVESAATKGGLEYQELERMYLRARYQRFRDCWNRAGYALMKGDVVSAGNFAFQATEALALFNGLKYAKSVRIVTEQLMRHGTVVLGQPGSTIIGSEIDILARIASKFGAFGVIVGGSAQHELTYKMNSHGGGTTGFDPDGAGGLPDIDVAFIADPATVSEIGKVYTKLMVRANHAPLVLNSRGTVTPISADNVTGLKGGNVGWASAGEGVFVPIDMLSMDPQSIVNAVQTNLLAENLIIIPMLPRKDTPGFSGTW